MDKVHFLLLLLWYIQDRGQHVLSPEERIMRGDLTPLVTNAATQPVVISPPYERDQRDERKGILPSTKFEFPTRKPIPRPYQIEE